MCRRTHTNRSQTSQLLVRWLSERYRAYFSILYLVHSKEKTQLQRTHEQRCKPSQVVMVLKLKKASRCSAGTGPALTEVQSWNNFGCDEPCPRACRTQHNARGQCTSSTAGPPEASATRETMLESSPILVADTPHTCKPPTCYPG